MTKPFVQLISEGYPKSTTWFMITIAMCASRAASDFTIALAWIIVFFRVIQVIGVATKKRRLSEIAYGFCAFVNFMMLLDAFIAEGFIK